MKAGGKEQIGLSGNSVCPVLIQIPTYTNSSLHRLRRGNLTKTKVNTDIFYLQMKRAISSISIS